MARTMSRPQRTARSGSSSCATGAPKNASRPSPMSRAIVPSYRCTVAFMRANACPTTAAQSSGSIRSAIAVDPARSAKRTVMLRRSLPPTSPLAGDGAAPLMSAIGAIVVSLGGGFWRGLQGWGRHGCGCRLNDSDRNQLPEPGQRGLPVLPRRGRPLAARAGVMFLDECPQIAGVLGRALARHDAVCVQLVPLGDRGDAARHPGPRVPADRAEGARDPAGHVLAEV